MSDPIAEAEHFNSIAPYVEENKQLREELQFFIACIDEGSLVRDISKDSDPNWHLKMVILVTHLQKAKELLK